MRLKIFIERGFLQTSVGRTGGSEMACSLHDWAGEERVCGKERIRAAPQKRGSHIPQQWKASGRVGGEEGQVRAGWDEDEAGWQEGGWQEGGWQEGFADEEWFR